MNRQNFLTLPGGHTENSLTLLLGHLQGTLDAMVNDDEEATALQASRALSEMRRILSRPKGAYACITLLQDCVLSCLLTFFAAEVSLKQAPHPLMAHASA